MNTKKCRVCEETFPLSEFYSNGTYKGKKKYKPLCKTCEMRYVRLDSYMKIYGDCRVTKPACSICGYSNNLSALEYHHTDSSIKEADITRLSRRGVLDKIQIELAKCILVCANCHREIHSPQNSIDNVILDIPIYLGL